MERCSTDKLDEETLNSLTSFAQASVFRRACMSVMAWSLTPDDRAQVRNAFLEMDTSNTGTVTLGEFKKVMQEKFHIEDAQVLQAFQAVDLTHTDQIHYSDFLAAMVASRIQVHDEVLAQTFRRFDTDNSGTITVENLKEVLGESFDGVEIQKLMSEADLTHSGNISYQEFIQYMKNGGATDHHHEACERVINHELRKPESPERSRNAGPERLKIRTTGVGLTTTDGTNTKTTQDTQGPKSSVVAHAGSEEAEPQAQSKQKQKSCCVLS